MRESALEDAPLPSFQSNLRGPAPVAMVEVLMRMKALELMG